MNNSEKYGIIYKCTNKINSFIYIGQTIQSLESRVKKHKDSDNNMDISKAFKEYGFDNFLWEEIDVAYSKEELNEQEKYWIKFYDSLSKNGHGYNKTKGGSGKQTSKHGPVIDLIDLHIYTNPLIAAKFIGESKSTHIINNCDGKRKSVRNHIFSWYDPNKKYKKATINHKTHQEMKVICLINNYEPCNKTYNSINEASRDLGISAHNILYRIRNKKSIKGYAFTFKDDNIKLEQKIIRSDGKIYNNVVLAAKDVNGHSRNILSCCRGDKHMNTSSGFKWSFYES
jgi:group I intron endonuclease